MVRIFQGDTLTGRDWCEENDVVGRIGRSTGSRKIPLLIACGEHGGPGLLDACIVRMMDVQANTDIYRHPLYLTPDISIKLEEKPEHPQRPWSAKRDGETVARFSTVHEASEYLQFMTGVIAATGEQLRQALGLRVA